MHDDDFVDHCLELLAPLGVVRARRMFGGHGLYIDDLFVAIIAFERLYLKIDAQSQPRFAAAGCEPFIYDGKGTPMQMSYWSAPPEAMESAGLMSPWGRLAIEAALRSRALSTKRRAAAKFLDPLGGALKTTGKTGRRKAPPATATAAVPSRASPRSRPPTVKKARPR